MMLTGNLCGRQARFYQSPSAVMHSLICPTLTEHSQWARHGARCWDITMIMTKSLKASQPNGTLLSKLRHRVVNDLPTEVEIARSWEGGTRAGERAGYNSW